MGDSNSAAIFQSIFEDLSGMRKSAERDRLALKYWKMAREYSFADDEMYCDDALIELGLARRITNLQEPGEDDCIEYGPAK